ncbi:hypothetical protein UNDKW_4336 [Undibacterium sp. KW1]|nr:hypothetical protein UNDKW_4336 [Undibacterium sp. KW1]
MTFMVASVGSFLSSDDVLRVIFIAGAIIGVALSVHLLSKKRRMESYVVIFAYWFSYLNLLSKYTYLFY